MVFSFKNKERGMFWNQTGDVQVDSTDQVYIYVVCEGKVGLERKGTFFRRTF